MPKSTTAFIKQINAPFGRNWKLAANASSAYTLIQEQTPLSIHHVTIPENSHDLPHPTKVVPFGIYGGGLLTGHPIGLVIVIGLLVMGLVGLPEAKWFFALAVPAGAICGFLMWLCHRNGLASH